MAVGNVSALFASYFAQFTAPFLAIELLIEIGLLKTHFIFS
jgi:hypothetical protein